MENLKCLILAAGKGSRMKSTIPKVLHELAGRAMIHYVIDAASHLNPQEIVTVIAPDMAQTVGAAIAPHPYVIQEKQRGTGDAVLAAQKYFGDFNGKILILLGDAPLINPDDLAKMVALMADSQGNQAVSGVLLTMQPDDPAAFGRVVTTGLAVDYIVEFLDASEKQREISLCNTGAMLFNATDLWAALAQVENNNANGEFYLPDVIGLLRKQGKMVLHHCVDDATEALGVNSKAELAALEYRFQTVLRDRHLANGVQMTDPETVYFSHDTKIGQDTLIEPNVFFAAGVEIEDGVHIKAFSHLEKCLVRKNSVIGPFARLRAGTLVGENCRIGNFVETKKTTFGQGSKASHLSYIGDADIGENVNIGAGTITCNYDGFFKYKTEIGDGAFIGSNTALVAPVMIGAGAIIGAGSTINEAVEADMLVLTRAHRIEKPQWATQFRNRKKAEKEHAQKAQDKKTA